MLAATAGAACGCAVERPRNTRDGRKGSAVTESDTEDGARRSTCGQRPARRQKIPLTTKHTKHTKSGKGSAGIESGTEDRARAVNVRAATSATAEDTTNHETHETHEIGKRLSGDRIGHGRQGAAVDVAAETKRAPRGLSLVPHTGCL